MKTDFTVVKILLFHGFFSCILDVASCTTSNPSATYSTISHLNSTRKPITTPALSSQNATIAALSSSVAYLSPTSHRLQSSTSHWIPVTNSRRNGTTASPTSAKTSLPTLGPLAARLPLFAVISGILGLILLMLLIYIVWNLCLKDCSLSRVQPSAVVT